MAIKCEECRNVFSQEDCLCDDYQDPARSVGCPECGVFYMHDESDTGKPHAVKRFVLASGVLVPSGMLLGQGIQLENGPVVFLALIVLFAAIFLVFDPKLSVLKKWKKSGHRRPLSE